MIGSASASTGIATVVCSQSEDVAVDADGSARRVPRTGARRSRRRVQHWLDIGRRAGDDAQDFARRGLLLQRSPCVSLEQPHVLDRDHGLIGEGFEQLNLPGR